jgi:hypothetical protein
MTYYRLAFFSALLLFGLAGCRAAPQPAPTQTAASSTTIPNTPTAISTATTVAIAAATLDTGVSKAPSPSEYRLDAEYDYREHILRVQEQIRYTNNSGVALEELLLIVEPQRIGAFFAITQAIWEDGAAIENYTSADGVLRIPLRTALQPEETLQFGLAYELVLPQAAGMLGWTERQVNFIDWYPFIPPYGDEGWIVNPAGIVGEHLAFESANFIVQLSVTNGPAGMKIAAGAPATEVEEDVWQYTLENARRFVWSLSGQYQQMHGEQDGIPVDVYVFAEHNDAGEAALATAKDALALYSELYGPYPYESLAVVEGLFLDGMEADGIFFLELYYFQTYNYSPRNYLTMLTAHETAHNWWYGAVGNDQANEPWLDESLATFSELLYYERVYPTHLAWWQAFRITDRNPQGWVNSTIYEVSGFPAYVDAVYFRGTQFLIELRVLLGDEAFFEFVQAYMEDGSGRVNTAEDFFRVLREYAGDRADEIISRYFEAE